MKVKEYIKFNDGVLSKTAGLFFVLLLSIFYSNSSCKAEESLAPYKIGVILPLSGKSSSVGIPMQKAALLAHESLPRRKKELIQLFFEDDQMQPKTALAAFQKLISVNGIKAVIVFGSAMGNAVAPIANQKGIVTIALVASDQKVWKGRKYVFSHWMPLESQAAAMLSEIRRRGYERLAMFSQEQEGINAVDKVFLEAMKKNKLDDLVVLKEKVLMDDTDFRTFISKARSRKVDAIYLITLPGSAIFSKQARALGLRADLFGVQTFENGAQLKASEGSLVGSWYVNADESTEEFTKTFKERFKLHPGLGAANSYDAVRLLVEAVSDGPQSAEAVSDFLRELRNYQGATGNYSGTGDNRFTLPVAVKEITTEGFRKIQR